MPNRSTGYCTDDVARAFIVATQAAAYPDLRSDAIRIGRTYLSFLLDAQLPDGRFRNFMAYDRSWLEDVGSDDACGRAVWALGAGARNAPLAGWRRVCRDALVASIPAITALAPAHARAYAALGLAHALRADPRSDAFAHALRALANALAASYRATRGDTWEWFENVMTYDSARLCEAALRAGETLADATLVEVGRSTLAFLESIVFESDRFAPIGNHGWYRRGAARARYDQQPLEAASMVDAELAALACDADPARLSRARLAFSWYLGNNDGGATLVSEDGGCRDGLGADGMNENMGAESTLAYLTAAFTLAEAEQGRAAKYGGDDRRNRRSERRPA